MFVAMQRAEYLILRGGLRGCDDRLDPAWNARTLTDCGSRFRLELAAESLNPPGLD
jgi:hypothetical protein